MIQEITCVFISHIHADHHLGLIRVLTQRKKILEESNITHFKPLLIIGPSILKMWLDECNDFEDLGCYNFVDSQTLLSMEHRNEILSQYFFSFFLSFSFSLFFKKSVIQIQIIRFMNDLLLKDFLPVEVIHCQNSYGIVIEHQNSWKIVYVYFYLFIYFFF